MKNKYSSLVNALRLFVLQSLLFPSLLIAQVVPTTPLTKNFLIEKGSGIACCSCPGITAKCDSIIEQYPKGKGFMMVYHFGPDARPQSGQLNKDYRTKFGDSILTPVWPFYLNMMVNRKDRGAPYGSTFIFGANDQVSPECAVLAAETAPVNLAFNSSYNPSTREITVNAKAYYTANSLTAKNFLQICLTEDSIVGPQCVNSPPFKYNYVHMDMFRANLNGPLGVKVDTTTAGTYYTGTFTYVLPDKFGTGTDQTAWIAPVIKNLKLVMFMAEDFNGFNTRFGRIQNVIAAPLGQGAVSGIANALPVTPQQIMVYPNPVVNQLHVDAPSPLKCLRLLGMQGELIQQWDGSSTLTQDITLDGLANGIYFLEAETANGLSYKKVQLQQGQ